MSRTKAKKRPTLQTERVSVLSELHPRRKVKKITVTIKLPINVLTAINQKNYNAVVKTPLRQGDGTVGQLEGIFTDDTERQIPSKKSSPTARHSEDFNDITELEREILSQLDPSLGNCSLHSHQGKPNIMNDEVLLKSKTGDGEPDVDTKLHDTTELSEEREKPRHLENDRFRKDTSTKPKAEYKSVPPNIIPLLKSELCNSESGDDEALIDSVAFSLNDPLGGGRIKFPVKSRFCTHLECFDYFNFCIFNKITSTTQSVTQRNLIRQNYDRLSKSDKRAHNGMYVQRLAANGKQRQLPNGGRLQFSQTHGSSGFNGFNGFNGPEGSNNLKDIRLPSYVTILENPNPVYTSRFLTPGYQNCPFYKCPICEVSFPLSALMVSDVFNYFLKMTSQDVHKVELLGSEKYRPIGHGGFSSTKTFRVEGERAENDAAGGEETILDTILISSDDGLDDYHKERIKEEEVNKAFPSRNNKTTKPVPPTSTMETFWNSYNRSNEGNGDSWDDPVVID